MLTPNLQEQIVLLVNQLSIHQKLLDQAFDENVELAKTKSIYHELKKISEQLVKLKALQGTD